MTEKVTVFKKLEPISGNGRNGPWQRQTVVFETLPNRFGDKHCIACDVFGDDVDELKKYPEGAEAEISYSVSSREYNGRWYTDVRLRNIVAPFAEKAPEPEPEPEDLPGGDDPDELPF